MSAQQAETYLTPADILRRKLEAQSAPPAPSDSTGNDFVDVVQGAFAGGVAGMLETADVLVPGASDRAQGWGTTPFLQGARALRGVQARNQPAPEARGTFLGEDFPSALGSVGSFAITGLAGGALGLGARAAAALSSAAGFVQSAGPAFFEAKARGRDDMTAWTAFLAHGAAGATEGLGSVVPGIARLGAWFAKADRTTGGSLSRSVMGSMLNLGKAGAREGLQETGQGFLGGAIDAYLLQYPDAQRDLVEILKDRAVREGAPGAVIGVLFGGLEQAVYAGAQERAGTTLVGKSPEVQAEAQTRTTGAPVVSSTPEESAALDRLRADLGDASAVIVEDAPEYAPAVEFGRKRGHTVRTVRAPQGFEGYFDEDTGTIFVREGMRPTDALDVVRGHEMAHALKSRNLGAWQELRDEIAGVDSAGLAEFEAAAAARYEQTTGRKMSDDLAQEEGVSYWTQNVLSPWLRQLERNPDRLAALAVDNRTFFRKLVEAGMDVLNSFGAKFKTRRAELAQLRAELGTAGARITLDQGRALAERYMRAMGGLAGELQTRELEAGAPNYDAAQGVDAQAQEVGGALAEGEYDMQVDQTLGAMGRTPRLTQAAGIDPRGFRSTPEIGDTVRMADGREGTVIDVTGSGFKRRVKVRADRVLAREYPETARPDSTLVEGSQPIAQEGFEATTDIGDVRLVKRAGQRTPRQERMQARASEEAATVREPRFALAPPTDSPEFKRWFGDSKVVDAQGRPLVVTHWTKSPFVERVLLYKWMGDERRAVMEKPNGEAEWWGKANAKRRAAMQDARYDASDALLSVANNDPDALIAMLDAIRDGKVSEQEIEALVPEAFNTDLWGRSDSGYFGRGSYFMDRNSSPNGLGKHRYDVYLKIENPYIPGVSSLPDGAKVPNPRLEPQAFTDALKGAGFDGVIALDDPSLPPALRSSEPGSKEYIVFRPEQIKSATGNRGTFDATNPDIRFAFALSDTLADTALGEHIEMRKAAYRDAYKGMFRKVVDYLDPVRDEMPNEYRSEMLRRSKTGQRIDNEMRPLRDRFVETMRKSGITLDEIGDFIQARGAGLRNYYAELINKDEGFNSGMKNEEAAPIIAAAKASGKYDAYVDLARQYDAINKRVRDIWRESGDRTAKYVDEIEQKYSHEAALEAGVADPDITWDSYYSAYRTATDEESLDGVGSQTSFTAGGQGLGVSGSPVFAAFGRRSRADNPVPFAFVDLQSAIIRAGKLEVAREIAAHVEKRNDQQFARVVSMPMRRALNPETGLVEDMPDPAWKGRSDTLAFKTADGKVRAIIFSRKYAHLAPILKGHTLTQPVIRKVAEWTRIFAGLLTRQNPAFFAVNYWRDLAQVVLAAHAKQGPDFARQVVLKQRRAIGEIYRAEFGGTRSAQMQEYLDSGARMGAYGFQDYADTAKSIEATLRGGRLREAGANFLRLIERFNDIAENATRYAVYQTAREKGMSIDEAAMLAKQEIGVNFERKGEYGPALSSLYAFAGAGIQGNANALSAMATKRGAAAVATIAALGFALDQMNRAVSGEDDDGELVYDNRPEWQKNASLIIELGGESALQLPMPHGWRWFFNLGRRTAAWATAGLYGASDFADLAFYEALDTVNPLGAGPVAQIASPTLLDPVVQLGSNETWTGKKIAPENLPFGAQKPDSDLYWRGTGELPIWMAQTLSEITDADDSGDGFFEVSPNTIEHFARVAFGGLGSTAVNIAENVGSLASGEVPTPKEAAIFNRFWAQNSPWAIDTRYSDARKEIESAEARYVELRKMGEGQRALEWRRANITLFKAIGALKATERSLSNLPNTPANEERRRTVKARFNRKLHEIKSSQA